MKFYFIPNKYVNKYLKTCQIINVIRRTDTCMGNRNVNSKILFPLSLVFHYDRLCKRAKVCIPNKRFFYFSKKVFKVTEKNVAKI